MPTPTASDTRIGEVFTPPRWADWLLRRWGICERWAAGASVCDPTAGEGVFAEALIAQAVRAGRPPSPAMLRRLHLVERKAALLAGFRERMKERYGVDFPESALHVRDVIRRPLKRRFDILVGNPPWVNFADLPPDYKQALKPAFAAYGLVTDKRAVLLGNSRIDIAALVLKVVLHHMLAPGGDGCFFAPLSLFTGDDAHAGFRDFRAKETVFSVEEVYEFVGARVFAGVRTAYCAVRFRRDEAPHFPVPYARGDGERAQHFRALPLKRPNDPWRVVAENAAAAAEENGLPEGLSTPPPRQGVNTCGANDIFIFDHKPEGIEPRYLFPLASRELWEGGRPRPRKWVFLPYDARTGRALAETALRKRKAFDYLKNFEAKLKARKGVLIQSAIQRGAWWSLLGVGPYAFAPYKVIWEAYGARRFAPRVLGSSGGRPWQGNQALHAFIPCATRAQAEALCARLKDPRIARLLAELNGQGKCNFAQPGKIKKVMDSIQK